MECWRHLAWYVESRLPLLQSAGVVEKFVDMVTYDQPTGEGVWARSACSHLAKIGRVAQDAIARTHNGNIFTWLAGPADHGRPYENNGLLSYLTSNHPIIGAARTGDTTLAKVLIVAICGGRNDPREHHPKRRCHGRDRKPCALRQSTTEERCVAALARAVSVLVVIVDATSNKTNDKLLMAQHQVVFLLVQELHTEGGREPLMQSPLVIYDHLNVLKDGVSDVSSKLLVVICLAKAVETELVAVEMVQYRVIPALLNCFHHPDGNSVCVLDLR